LEESAYLSALYDDEKPVGYQNYFGGLHDMDDQHPQQNAQKKRIQSSRAEVLEKMSAAISDFEKYRY
jgi:hypothetical protein